MGESDQTATPNTDAVTSPLTGTEDSSTKDSSTGDSSTEDSSTKDSSTGDSSTGDSSTKDWRAYLNEDLAKHERLADVEDLNTIVQDYLDRPQVPETYSLPEEYPYEGIKDVAKKAKMTQAQLDAVIEYQASEQQRYNEHVKSTQQTELAAYKKEKGAEWDETVRLSRGALAHLDDNGKLREFLRVTGAGQIPLIIDLFAKVGKLLNEDGLIKGDADSQTKPTSPAKIIYPDLP